MTAPLSTSTALKSRPIFLTYFLYKLYRLRGTLITVCVSALLSFPLAALGINIYTDAWYEFELNKVKDTAFGAGDKEAMAELSATLMVIIAVLAAVVLFFLAFVTAKENFRYYYNKKYTDFDYSLPISAGQRFLSDLLSGAFICILPVLVSFILGRIMIGHSETLILLLEHNFEYVLGIFDNLGTAVVCACVLHYFLSVLTLSFCGNKLSAYVLPLIYMFFVPIGLLFGIIIVCDSCYGGSNMNIFGVLPKTLLSSTPTGILGMLLLGDITSGIRNLWTVNYFLEGRLQLCTVLYGAVFSAAAYFIAVHRRTERTGSAFVYSGARYVTETVIILGSAAPAFMSIISEIQNDDIYDMPSSIYYFLGIPPSTYIIAWVLINMAVFAVIELISGVKPRELPLSAVRFAVTAALSAAVVFGLSYSDGLGRGNYVPEVSDIESIRLDESFPGDTYETGYTENSLEDDDNIKNMITDFHRKIVTERCDLKAAYLNGDTAFTSVRIIYNMKNGERLYRDYTLTKEFAREAYKLYFDTGAFALAYKRDTEYTGGTVSIDDFYMKEDGGYRYYGEYNTDIPLDEFYEALSYDAENTDFEDVYRNEGVYVRRVSVVMRYGNDRSLKTWLTLFSSFERTKELFGKYGVDLFGGETQGAVKYYLRKYRSVGGMTAQTKYSDEEVYHELRDVAREISEADALTLLEYSSSVSVYEEERDVYMLTVVKDSPIYADSEEKAYYHTEYFITEPYCDTAAKIWNGGTPPAKEDLINYWYSYKTHDDVYIHDGEYIAYYNED